MSEYKCNQCSKTVRSRGLPARWIREYSGGSGSSERKYLCGSCLKALGKEQERNKKRLEDQLKLEGVLENWRTA